MSEVSLSARHATASEGAGRLPLWLRILGVRLLAPAALAILSIVMFVPGVFQVPPLDRDEPRFAQASKQMAETGDFVDIRFQDEARHKKPAGIYWLQAAAVEASGFGDEAPIWVYRLPSQIAAVLSVLLVYWAARAFVSPQAAFVAGVFAAITIILGVEARIAKTDATLLATILAAQGALARLWLNGRAARRWGWIFIFWTALGVSVLVKGPVGPMVAGLTIASLCVVRREVAWLKALAPLPGIAWFALVVAPWFVAIHLATDGAFFNEAVGKDFVGKIGAGQESHGAPPLTHLAAMFATFWPLPAFLILAIGAIRRRLSSDVVLFTLAWVLPSWVVFELVATKLPHYTLPLLPALSILTAAALVEGSRREAGRISRWAAAAVYFVPAFGLAAANFAVPVALGLWPSPPGAVLAIIGFVAAFAATRQFAAGRALYALAPAVGASALIFAGTWAFTMPTLDPLWISPRLAAAVKDSAPCPDPLVASAGFNEPSYVFLQGTDTLLTDAAGAANHLAGETNERCRIAVVERRREAGFLKALSAEGISAEEVGRVSGININGGDRLDIGVYRRGSEQDG
ncbi:phospholipid carrier-dependent glycosyltransferase [Stappia sp. GBMRC 2046]|uniref:Phospholipid carrier-dependent glycosyltransferase n=1 Tax=Stappia sediminis TaxID=2692190 RepID=A0A7X3S6Y9_9HYPH|nr:glycosyltransferase family 39 protein [Stappia sediminis]MXN64275.1 phospholipid carrier-dependent glycosyltransferase [Stappia sediminis]